MLKEFSIGLIIGILVRIALDIFFANLAKEEVNTALICMAAFKATIGYFICFTIMTFIKKELKGIEK